MLLQPAKPIVQHLAFSFPIELSQAEAGRVDVFLLTPTLRTLGNIFATAKPAEILPSFSARGPHHMLCVLAAANLPQYSLQKEALWVLSNFAALHTNERLSPQFSPETKWECSPL